MFTPQYIGTINQRARLSCMGIAFGADGHLIFINAQGASTLIEQLDAEIRGRGTYISIDPDYDRTKMRRMSGYANKSENSTYVVRKQAIPNSTDLSMIAIHQSVNERVVDIERPYSYLVYDTLEDLKVRLWHRVHRLINIPISRTDTVMEFLLKRAQLMPSGAQAGVTMVKLARTMEQAKGDPITRHWEAWGINAATVSNNRANWEAMISKAVRDKDIPL